MMRRTWQRLLVVLGALTLSVPMAAVAVAPADDGVDWAGLPYYDHNAIGQFFSVPTNGETFTARRITNSYSGFDINVSTPEQRGGKGLEAIWNKTCPPVDSQRMSQSRDVFLPGQPAQLLVNLQMTVLHPGAHKNKNPIAWAEVRINNTVVARVERATTKHNRWLKVDASNLAGNVTFGLNTITVVAKKAKTQKSWGYCSHHQEPDFGVSAEVYGLPGSDIRASIPTTQAGDGVIDLAATIANDGPSSIVGGTNGGGFNFTTFEETGTNVTGLTLTSSATTCTTFNTPDGFAANCPLPVISPGDSITVNIHVEFQPGCPSRIPVSFRAWAWWNDPDPVNNGQSDRAIAC